MEKGLKRVERGDKSEAVILIDKHATLSAKTFMTGKMYWHTSNTRASPPTKPGIFINYRCHHQG
jgi:hypothetical protein